VGRKTVKKIVCLKEKKKKKKRMFFCVSFHISIFCVKVFFNF